MLKLRLYRRVLIWLMALVMIAFSSAVQVSVVRADISWPASQFLPSFPSPALPLNYVNLTGYSTDERTLFTTLQGVVNRNQPRIYLWEGGDEGEFTWLNSLGLTYNSVNAYNLITTYRTELAGLVIFDPAQPDTRNLATTIAGLNNYLAVSPSLAATLNGAPYNLPTRVDLRSNGFTSRVQIYQYAFDNYWSQTTRRLIVGLDPTIGGFLRDYAVATRAMVVWLDARDTTENNLLRRFLEQMPANAPYIGWFPNPENAGEQAAVNQLSSFGLSAIAADFAANLTVYGGMSRTITPPAAPAPPTLQNKIYVTMIMSDGDNIQYMQHLMRRLWNDPRRGQVTMGWTISPTLVDAAPQMLNYYWSTVSSNEVLLTGPSGLGYAYPNSMPSGALTSYTQLTNTYQNAAGVNIITLWQNDTSDPTSQVNNAYAVNLPGVLGLTTQNENNPSLRFINDSVPIIGFRENYGGSENELRQGIDSLANGWSGNAPLFIAIQGTPFAPFGQTALSPTAFYNVQQAYAGNANIVFVRPDHFFQLARQTNQLQPPTTQTNFTFDADLQGWTGSTSGKPYDSVAWSNTVGNPVGGIAFDGSDLGNRDEQANATAARQIILPANAQTLTFDTRGAGTTGGQIRVRIAAGGASTTLLNWETYQSSTWVSRSANIAAYAGQTVTIYFEHNDSGPGNGEQRYVDNIRINTGTSSTTLWTFDSNTQGWTGATAGGQYDRAAWGAAPGNPGGALQLDGSDFGNPNSQVNAWFSQSISLPANAQSLTFDTRGSDQAGYGGKLRVRLVSGSTSVTLLDFERVTGSTWVSRSANIAAYAGQTVTIFFEHNDNQFGIGEHRYIDNVRITTSSTTLWTFDSNTQGWTGATAGGQYDRAAWGAAPGNPGGALQLDGSDFGNPNSQVNAWFSQSISLPANAQSLTFDTRGSDQAGYGGKLRVRLVSGSTSVTLLDFERVTGSTWVSRSANIAAYAGQTVTIFFEHNDNQFGIGEHRYIDNIRIVSGG